MTIAANIRLTCILQSSPLGMIPGNHAQVAGTCLPRGDQGPAISGPPRDGVQSIQCEGHGFPFLEPPFTCHLRHSLLGSCYNKQDKCDLSLPFTKGWPKSICFWSGIFKIFGFRSLLFIHVFSSDNLDLQSFLLNIYWDEFFFSALVGLGMLFLKCLA